MLVMNTTDPFENTESIR